MLKQTALHRPRRSALLASSDLLLLTMVTLWGMNFAVSKYAISHFFTPLAYSASRFTLATAAFTGVAYAHERSLYVDRRSLRVMAALGACVILANQVAFIYALQLSSASTVALLFGTMPVFAALASRERLGGRHWLAAAVSFGGVALVASGAQGGISGDLG